MRAWKKNWTCDHVGVAMKKKSEGKGTEKDQSKRAALLQACKNPGKREPGPYEEGRMVK